MGEGITAAVTAKSGGTAVSIFIRGRITAQCLEELKQLIKDWAENCHLTIDSVNTSLKPLPPGAALKKATKKATKK
jgi:hypothetical protein